MMHGTTILAIRHGGKVVVVGDGQVSLGQTVMKHSARKVRKLHHDRVIAGFAGATADAFTLFEKFEAKLEQFNGNLKRAAVELAKDWRTDRVLRRLEALLIVADVSDLLVISGAGDVVEHPQRDDGAGDLRERLETGGEAHALLGRRDELLHAARVGGEVVDDLGIAGVRAREAVETGLTAAGGLDPFLTYERPALRLGSRLVESLEKEGSR